MIILTMRKGQKAWNNGLKLPEEQKVKISNSKKGKSFGGAKKGCIPWNKKKDYDDGMNYKELNHHLRTSRRWAFWRTNVFQRDGYMCQECGNKNMELHPHHIVSVKQCVEICNLELIYDVDNGKTLCVPCHRLKHKKRLIGDG
jgi:hypothetical protein